MQDHHKIQSPLNIQIIVEKIISGAVAGIVGTAIIFPIDSVKTRLQSGTRQYSGSFRGLRCLVDAVKNQGTFSLYRGLGANLLGVTPEKAIKLSVNDISRSLFANHLHVESEQLPMFYGVTSGAIAGLCQVIATNPMEIVKIQMQLDHLHHRRRSIIQVVKDLGFSGIYRGTISTLMRDIPFSMLFFQSFASFKQTLRRKDSDGGPQLGVTLISGMLSGTLAAFVVTPMDVVKTRLQASLDSKKTPPITLIYSRTLKMEGIAGLFRGAPQRCLIIAPLFAISLFVYEAQQYLFKTEFT